MVSVRVPADVWGDVEAEGLLSRWLVADGAPVQAGQVVAEVVIVKSNLEVTAPATGTLRIKVAEQDTFGREQDLAVVE